MKKLTPVNLKKMWFDFFVEKGHAILPSASLIPENDATVLFTTAGMHPLVPYLLGEKHPAGTRLCSCQKCFRTNDIDEVGDSSHCTFFEMLGNWSLGDFFKKEAIAWSFEFLTSEKWLGIPVEKLAVSVFAGDENCERDIESAIAWEKCGLPKSHIFFLPKKNNWWDLGGGTGPCGPDTEMFFITDREPCCESCSPACDCGRWLEIWNDVFMQYNVPQKGAKPELLSQKNVDTGMGLERTVCVLNGVQSVFDTGSLKKGIDLLIKHANVPYAEALAQYRIIVDHIRSAVMAISDGVFPKNVGAGYVLRRLLRRSLVKARALSVSNEVIFELAELFVCEMAESGYPELKAMKSHILSVISAEIVKFSRSVANGEKEFEKITRGLPPQSTISGIDAFRLLDTFGFPFEITKEQAAEKGLLVDEDGFKKAFEAHQALSRAGGAALFKGGLSDTGGRTTLLHTATHILLAGLKKMFGNQTEQKGSNITPERLRFDFNCDHKLTAEEKTELENFVNDAIRKKIDVVCHEMTLDEAKAFGAHGVFAEKYGNRVKVFEIKGVDVQICGGPHAKNTSELISFKIQKEESSSNGIRRIKATIDEKAGL